MIRRRPLFFLLILGFFLSACNRKLETPAPPEYYPITDGKYRDYYVIDTTFTTGGPVRATYYKRELTNGTVKDLNSRNVSKLEIWRASDSTAIIYSFYEMWSQFKSKDYAERTEGNTRFLVLGFPYIKNFAWNGNAFNNLDTENYRYTNLDTTVVVNGKTYVNCVSVMQSYTASRCTTINAFEIYAPNIGKIKRYNKRLYSANCDGNYDTGSVIYSEELVGHNY